MGGLDNPSYEQNIIQSTQSNGNIQDTDLPEDQYSIPVKIQPKTMTSDSQVNDTSSGVQMVGIYSLANDEQVEKGLYSHLQRN